jgi:hypothetical protein
MDERMSEDEKVLEVWRLFCKIARKERFAEMTLFDDGSGGVLDAGDIEIIDWGDLDDAIAQLEAYLSQQ